jgi:glycosyltransferase involved in cell wall biosynthesis
MTHVDRPIRLVVAGDGTAAKTEALAVLTGLSDRIDFRGAVEERELLDLYRDALAVVYTPFDEDYGYVTVEAFLASKPVITVTDAGGPLEFVEHRVNGFICEPASEALADAINQLSGDRVRAASLGRAGFERTRSITWDGVIHDSSNDEDQTHHPDSLSRRGRDAAGNACGPPTKHSGLDSVEVLVIDDGH